MIDDIDPYAVDEKWRKPRWTFEEVQAALQLRAALCSDDEIGEYLGRSVMSVRAKLQKELSSLRRLDAVVARDLAQPLHRLPKVFVDALLPAAGRYTAGSVPALCRELVERLAGRPEVVEQLMGGGR